MSGGERLSAAEKRQRYRRILGGELTIKPASVFDPLSALAAEDLGYECGVLGGSIASLAVLGAPDIALLTLSEFVEQVRRICRAGNLPLMVDADHGYGNALNVRRTVEDLEAAGVAALSIEDTVMPDAFGSTAAQLVSPQEAAGKLRAALQARIDPGLAILGRTNARLATGKDLLERQQRYQDTGIDALFVVGVRTLEQLEPLAAAATVPLVLGAPMPGIDAATLASFKVRVCLQGHKAFFKAAQLIYDQLAAARGMPASEVDADVLVKRLSGDAQYEQWSKDFLQ
ncbi:isocitrate lyase/phosphoenolpyruvate mutase family protein [Herbaspirillum lusitanum]|uniref:Isocitrate lyase/phosphoenolpyruvate mutase family protein n=1 Tax=Herbaspirillum lusitanum TaxID=213312 RepID=A0ABW9ADL9_9BURK